MTPPTRIEYYRIKIKDSASTILQYDRQGDNLQVWPWPMSPEACIPPCALQDHRISHRMAGPCCLCPMMDATKPDTVEAAIYMATQGEQAGKYVATCAKDECGYTVPLEKFYDKLGPVKAYARRAFGEEVLPRVTHVSESRPRVTAPRPLKRTYAMLDINADAILERPAPALRPSHKMEELLCKLDAQERPGVSEFDFVTLFRKCKCRYYMTCRAFMDHDCLNEVVDLTNGN